tara:strand:+ start:1198 stop:1308 length:111 start_codon:yes stop_codon:yes gene_type:complete
MENEAITRKINPSPIKNIATTTGIAHMPDCILLLSK